MRGERLHQDFETGSLAAFGDDKQSVGLWRYARHPTTRVWCLGWRFDKRDVGLWWRHDPFPQVVIDHVADGGTVVAHNGPFECDIWNEVLPRTTGLILPQMKIEQVDCTMARCKALGLPPDLERAARIVKAPYQKDMSGSDIMKEMSKPRRVTFSTPAAGDAFNAGAELRSLVDAMDYSVLAIGDDPEHTMRLDWNYDLDRRQRQSSYCMTDVLAECGVDDGVSPLSPAELQLWQWNERVNTRGIPFDFPLIEKIQATVTAGRASADRRMWTLTNGAVKKVTQHAAFAQWLTARGIEAPSVNKHVTDDLVAVAQARKDDNAEEAVQLHAASSKSSTSKMAKAKQMRGADDCVHHVFSYHSAGTGRFSAYGYQAHNLVRIDEDAELPTVRQVIDILTKFDPAVAYEAIDIIFGRAMHWLSKCARPTIKAPAGKIFRGADLSNIEGRQNAWTAGEQWKLDAFKAYDEGRGPDSYKVTAATLLNIKPEDVTKLQRQAFGKVPELASGFQGSVGAYVRMGVTTGVRADQIASAAAETTDPRVWAATAKLYRPQFSVGLEQSVWTGVKVVVNAWRQKHPNIVQSWWDRQDGVLHAVSNPGQIVPVCEGRIRYMANHGFLWTMLPSGRLMAYPQPEIIRVTEIKEKVIDVVDGVEIYEEYEITKNVVQVWGIDGQTKQWTPYTLYGGILCENDTQAGARDICFDGVQRWTAAGYDVCFHCHDEGLTVCDPWFGSRAELESLLTVQPSYAPGIPLAAKAWEDERYVK